MKTYLSSITAAALGAFTLLSAPLSAAAEPTVLITGSNRGIGFAMTQVYAERGATVIATARNPSDADELNALAAEFDTIKVEELDVTDDAEIAALAEKYRGQPIDILINNAGIPGPRDQQQFGNYDLAVFDQVMHVNVVGPLKVAEAFIEHVKASEQQKIINITSTQGSIAENAPGRGNSYFYKASKTALNMVMNMLAMEMKPQGVTVGLISPGFVDTNFGGLPSMPIMISPEESARSVIAVIDDYDLEKSGRFFTHEGEEAPW